MNNHLYRIVFNVKRGQLMVVAETASAQGKTAGDTRGGSGGGLLSAMRPVCFAVLAALGMAAPLTQAQIVADPNAPGNQRSTILRAANGVALINIPSPTAAGLSIAAFSDYSVPNSGVILNNSRTNVQTQLGGFVLGNPMLATGSARGIVIQVNSNNPTNLNGPTEIAGPRTPLVIASPSGTGFDNQGGQAQALGNVSIAAGAGAVNNTGGLVRSAATTTLSGAGIVNSNTLGANQGIEGHNVAINAGSVANDSGKSDGSDTSYTNTEVKAGDQASITSGGNITLQGALVKAGQIKATVGGDLKIESPQDTSTYQSEQKNASASVSIGFGKMSGSVSMSSSDINSDFKSVGEQSGLKAGDGGFQVKVEGDTDLKGGVIASNQAAVEQGKNSFSTGGTLTTTAVQNTASYEGKGGSFGIGGGVTADAKGISGLGIGWGNAKGDASSTTSAGISGIAGNTAVRSTDAEAGLKPIFDAEKVQRDIDAQMQITQAFTRDATKAVGDFAQGKMNDAKALRRQATDQQDPDRAKALNDQAQALEDTWGEGKTGRVGLHALVGALTGDIAGALGAATSQTLVPLIDAQIAKMDLPTELRDALIAVAGTAIGAAAGGTAGAISGLTATANNYLTHDQAQEKKAKLAKASTDVQRQQISDAYDKLDAQQRAEAATCLLKDQCASVFEKPSLRAVLDELFVVCTPPRLCTSEEKSSIAELQNFYVHRDAVIPDTTVEEFLLANKAVGAAFGIVRSAITRLAGETATTFAKPLGVVEDFHGNVIKAYEAAPQYAFKTDVNFINTGANLEASATQFVKDEAGKDFIAVFNSKTGVQGFDLAYAKTVNGQPQLIIGEAKAGDSALTALGENSEKTLARNLATVKRSINEMPEGTTKETLLRQLDEKTYQVELYTTTGNAAKTASRIDNVLTDRLQQPIMRVVTFGKL